MIKNLNPKSDADLSDNIREVHRFPLFLRLYSGHLTTHCKLYSTFALQIHVNGYVSLDYPLYPGWMPQLYRYYSWSWRYNSAVIAPFWADIDLRYTDGVVYLGHFSRSYAGQSVTSQAAEVFEAVRLLVRNGAGDTGFLPTEVVTVTWQNVSPYPAFYDWYRSQVHAYDANTIFTLCRQCSVEFVSCSVFCVSNEHLPMLKHR